MRPVSRREFGALTLTAVAGSLSPRTPLASAPIAASEIVERIRTQIGAGWKPDTVDTIKAGDPSTPITGIVTTALASIAVLRQAATTGANMVVTCEPTFYGRGDSRTPSSGRGGRGAPAAPAAPAVPIDDPIYAAKNALIDTNRIVVFRLSDHWRGRRPDPFGRGLARTLGWSGRQTTPEGVARYTLPATSLATLAGQIKASLRIRGGMRVVGDPEARIRTIGLLPGSTPIGAALDLMPSVDAVVAGEVREWESVEYARDVVFSGQRKALLLVGRVVSEEGGMAECASWLAGVVPEVKVRHISAGDPYWRPA